MAQLVKKRNNKYSDIKQTCISHINKIDSSVLVIFFILMILNKQNITIFLMIIYYNYLMICFSCDYLHVQVAIYNAVNLERRATV